MFNTTKRTFMTACCLLGLGVGLLGAAQAQTALDDITKAKLVKIAIPSDFPPYGFVGTDLQPQGLDVDMAKAITDLSQGVTTQQALLAAGAKISQLNLFSYLPSS